MQVIVKCPECGKNTLAKAAATPMSEVSTTDVKKCGGCGIMLEVQIKISVKSVKPEGAKK